MNDRNLTHETLRALVETAKWADVITLTNAMPEPQRSQPGFAFFRGMALTKDGRQAEAIPEILRGLSLNPKSGWGNKLLFDARIANGQVSVAFTEFAAFIDSSSEAEADKSWYVQRAVDLDLFDIAAEMNQKREVIRSVPTKPDYALAVQCFCKADTLREVFSSLCNLDSANEFALIILQDSEHLSQHPQKYISGCNDVQSLVSEWQTKLAKSFFSVEYLKNHRNLGTAPTCRRLLDYTASRYKGFLFIEDDCVLARSALDWSVFHLDYTITADGPWFVTCESSFFDKEDRALSDDLRIRLDEISMFTPLQKAYVLNSFVNSTCFGIRSDIWNVCSNVRSFTRGPESLNRFVANRGMKTIAPVVPRAADIGMLHELGYSVATVGSSNAQERKGTYLLCRGQFDGLDCAEFTGDKDLLFRATSRLDVGAIGLVETRLRMIQN